MSYDIYPEVLLSGRRSGKTEHLIKWLASGKCVDFYPGWSRIVLTATLEEADQLRKGVLRERFPDEDTYRWVFSVQEWQHGHIPNRHAVEIGVDNADLILATALGVMPHVMTITGRPWNGS